MPTPVATFSVRWKNGNFRLVILGKCACADAVMNHIEGRFLAVRKAEIDAIIKSLGIEACLFIPALNAPAVSKKDRHGIARWIRTQMVQQLEQDVARGLIYLSKGVWFLRKLFIVGEYPPAIIYRDYKKVVVNFLNIDDAEQIVKFYTESTIAQGLATSTGSLEKYRDAVGHLLETALDFLANSGNFVKLGSKWTHAPSTVATNGEWKIVFSDDDNVTATTTTDMAGLYINSNDFKLEA